MNKFLLAAMLGSTLLAGPAYAQADPAPPPGADHPMPPRPNGMAGMMRADTNHDGVITRDEAIAMADRQFDRLDANHDGKITEEEAQRARPPRDARGAPPPETGEGPPPEMSERAFDRADRNDDGRVTRDEYRAAALDRFERLDANHDGRIDQGELAAAMQNMRGMGGMGGPRGGPGGDMPPPPRDGQ